MTARETTICILFRYKWRAWRMVTAATADKNCVVVDSAGTVWTCGDNFYGQLGERNDRQHRPNGYHIDAGKGLDWE